MNGTGGDNLTSPPDGINNQWWRVEGDSQTAAPSSRKETAAARAPKENRRLQHRCTALLLKTKLKLNLLRQNRRGKETWREASRRCLGNLLAVAARGSCSTSPPAHLGPLPLLPTELSGIAQKLTVAARLAHRQHPAAPSLLCHAGRRAAPPPVEAPSTKCGRERAGEKGAAP
ncbi:hypothetical protein SETIT_8G048100v2 [Setaria italica]|uniref:Uncharacterized protein n=1 Tax=Setaria italica TaxID=4555 RepID=A0A368S4F4_SETIT|nr:hypothetical protein SETIT_8G048100v2 [Setaria italica]